VFDFVEADGKYGFTAGVNGSALHLIVFYRPDDHALIFNEHKYILRRGTAHD